MRKKLKQSQKFLKATFNDFIWLKYILNDNFEYVLNGNLQFILPKKTCLFVQRKPQNSNMRYGHEITQEKKSGIMTFTGFLQTW